MLSKRKGHLLVLLAALLAFGFCASPLPAESIWARRQSEAAFLYTDNVASEVGDSLTVLIADQSSFSLEGERESEKTTSHAGQAHLETIAGSLDIPAASLTQDSNRTFEGSDEYTATRQFSDSITVIVKDRLPNGNMVVAGRKERIIAGEEVVTVLNGVVRPEDVSGTNSISSRLVAHLRMYYETTGTSEAYLEEGFLNRIISIFWPF